MFACSGPGASHTIAESIEIGFDNVRILAIVIVVSMIVSFFSKRRFATLCLYAMFALHPAWTISALSGDCGYFKRDASEAFTLTACFVLAAQLLRTGYSCFAARSRRSSSSS
jgi:hypothetical protein